MSVAIYGAGTVLPPAVDLFAGLDPRPPLACMQPRLRDETMAIDLLLPACQQALTMAGCGVEDIDLIISKSTSPSHIADDKSIVGPRVGHPLQRELGAYNAFVFDLLDADWGFALDVAHGFLHEFGFRRALLVHTECTQGLLPDKVSGFAVPDGAGALVVGPAPTSGHGPRFRAVPWQTAAIELLPVQDRAAGRPNVSLRLAGDSQLGAVLEIVGQAVVADSMAGLHLPLRYGYESWFPGYGLAAGQPRDWLLPATELGHLGPFTLPHLFAQAPRAVDRPLLFVSFSPFQMRMSSTVICCSRGL